MTAKEKVKETPEVKQPPENRENRELEEDARIKDLTEKREKRDKLIAEISPKLLSNANLRSGGAGVRSKHSQELASFGPVLNEINELGKILGNPPVGLGSLREE